MDCIVVAVKRKGTPHARALSSRPINGDRYPERSVVMRTLEESTIIERVARIVSSVRGAKPDYTRLATELEQAIPFDVFGVALLRHDRQAVRVTACHSEGAPNERRWVASYRQHPLNEAELEQ